MTYSEKLKDPRWQKKRLEIMQRDGFCCGWCTNKDRTLHVHHKNYDRGKEPWDYENENLITLCDSCHEEVEALKRKVQNLMGCNIRASCIDNCANILMSENWIELVDILSAFASKPSAIKPLNDLLKSCLRES